MSKIEWTEKTWNPVTGCTKVSAGCRNCYAEGIAKRFWGNQEWHIKDTKYGCYTRPRKFTDIMLHEDRLQEPLKRKKPTMYFVNSMSDLFHEDVPADFIESIFEIMSYCKHHTFQILTKRPRRMINLVAAWVNKFGLSDNIWLGVSVENQATANERISWLLKTPAKVRFLSVEPLLERVDLTGCFIHEPWPKEKIDWVIVGCESGPKKRECKIEWIKTIIGQCKLANVPVFVKQIRIGNKVVKNTEDFPVHTKRREYPTNRNNDA